MCTEVIQSLKEEFNLPIKVCGEFLGNGEITTFCGHDVQEECPSCYGKGYNTVKKKKKKKIVIDCKKCVHHNVPGASHDLKACYGCGVGGIMRFKEK